MAHTFDIRFARSAGFVAMLEAPDNSFRWTGNGCLSIDAQGISVAAKRGLSSLRARNRMHRIHAADLKEVFREGEALRVEFTAGKARASLKFWANDRETAARIVRLLPTTRTVELEEDAARGAFRFDRRVTISMAAVLVAIAGGVVLMRFRNVPAPDPAIAAVDAEASTLQLDGVPEPAVNMPDGIVAAPAAAALPATGMPVTAIPAARAPAVVANTPPASRDVRAAQLPAEVAASSAPAVDANAAALPDAPSPAAADRSVITRVVLPATTVQADAPVTALPRGTAVWNEALRQLALFGSDNDDMVAALDADRELFETGQISRRAFAMRIEAQAARWRDVAKRITDAEAFSNPLLADLRATLLASARYQQNYIDFFAAGIRDNDQRTIERALRERKLADDLHARARRFID